MFCHCMAGTLNNDYRQRTHKHTFPPIFAVSGVYNAFISFCWLSFNARTYLISVYLITIKYSFVTKTCFISVSLTGKCLRLAVAKIGTRQSKQNNVCK